MLLIKYRCEQYSQVKNEALKLLRDNSGKDGNIVHVCNDFLGLIALREKDIVAAKKYLSASGKTKGAWKIGPYGPDFILANGLLELGERQAVLDYLKQVGRFWKAYRERIDEWTKQIKAGDTPLLSLSFGPTP